MAGFAQRAGFAVVGESVGGRAVRLRGPTRRWSEEFAVRLRRVAWNALEVRAREGPIHLPRELEGIVVAVLGLDNRPQARPHRIRHRTEAPTDVAYDPPAVAAAYSFPPGSDGSGEALAVLELGGGFSASDLRQFFARLSLPTPTVTVVPVDGASNSPTGSVDGPDGEVELDLEIAGSLAPGARLIAYFAPNTDEGFLDGVNAAIHDATNRPSILSISWGGPEPSWTDQARNALNAACEDAAALGVTVLVAAGDAGATDGSTNGALTVDFPASSPYVVACGGTRLVLTPARSEVVWNELAIHEGATGGGVSESFARPSFQSNVGVPAAPNGFVGRGVPDVAGDADPASGYHVVVDGQSIVLGGTSAVAPLWAALVARLNEALGSPLGYLTPRLYDPAETATFTDIVSGNNDGYTAGPGWDACTGWGSPNGMRLLAALQSAPNAPSP